MLYQMVYLRPNGRNCSRNKGLNREELSGSKLVVQLKELALPPCYYAHAGGQKTANLIRIEALSLLDILLISIQTQALV